MLCKTTHMSKFAVIMTTKNQIYMLIVIIAVMDAIVAINLLVTLILDYRERKQRQNEDMLKKSKKDSEGYGNLMKYNEKNEDSYEEDEDEQ